MGGARNSNCNKEKRHGPLDDDRGPATGESPTSPCTRVGECHVVPMETTSLGLTVGKTLPGHALVVSPCHAESTHPRVTWKRVPSGLGCQGTSLGQDGTQGSRQQAGRV